MERYLLNDIQYEPDIEGLRNELHIQEGSSIDDDLLQLAHEAKSIAKPKALYYVSFIDEKADDSIVVEGTTFFSRVLRVNVDDLHRVFPYAATCGTELHEWASPIDGLMQAYIADMIMESALERAIRAMEEDIENRFRPGTLSEMNPGSLGDWPIEEQRPLFNLLGDTEETIGVTLKDSLLMIPTKSVSGIKFASERSFASCQLCPREHCRGRSAPFDPDLYEQEYAMK